ncbi:NAD(+)/NADH kinase [Gandjariella thermophila]|uniref:NAD(+)/NADH kinase n=1 Tax=Gandjariella thermophila TaxID=1931992 RepID=UPI001CEF58C4|nr:NAD(+)/NADH kinase [Gandjariella thermophila]
MGVIGAVGLVLHPGRRCAPVVDTITGWARERGVTVLGLDHEVVALECHGVAGTDAATLGARADVLISLGGDGTMLRAMRLAYDARTPVLGVNLGRLGFLAEVDVPELAEALSAIDENRFTVEARSGLLASSAGCSAVAFNDIALVRVPGHGMSNVQLHVDGQPFVRYSADAVVVATPTGSTAYSFSAGGPIVSPRAEGLLVTPVAPHSAFNRALFLSTGEKLVLEVLRSSGELAVEADGRLIAHTHPGDLIDTTVVSAAARVIRLGRTTFYQRAQRRLRLTNPLEADAD